MKNSTFRLLSPTRIRSRLTYANVVATLALFAALGGGAYAAVSLPADSVGTKQIKNRAVTPPKLARSTMVLFKAKIKGVPAGGDLRGTYPKPRIANGAIKTSNFGTIPAVGVENSTTQSIPNKSITLLKFDTNVFDTAGLHKTGTNSERLTAPVAGTYMVSAMTQWGMNVWGQRVMLIDRSDGASVTTDSRPPDRAGHSISSVAGITHLSAGQYVTVAVYQDSGAALDADLNGVDRFAMVWLGP